MTTDLPAPEGGEAFVDALISEFGDEREALRAVLAEYVTLQRRYELARVAISTGYSRGWHHQRAS